MEIKEQYIVLDIETNVIGAIPNAEVDELRYVGFKYKDKKVIYHYTEKQRIQEVLSFAKYIVGHNLKGYDIPILKRYGIYVNRDQIIIDTLEISINRLKSMLSLDLNQGDQSLDKLCERFKLPIKKLPFDYSLLKKDILEDKEYLSLEEYLYADLDCADELFKFFYEFFYGFREYMSEDNQRKMCWLINKPGSCAYKCVTNLAKLPEDYDESLEEDDKYDGGFVALPYKSFDEGNIYLYDFKSLYPHMMMGFNLYSQTSDRNYFRGSSIYPTIYGNDIDGVRGKYKTEKLGIIENIIKSLFEKRQQSKDNPQQYLAIKILINTCYGLLGSPKFKSVYSLIAASDCTALARRSTKHARTVLVENGYECLYTDTDSIFIKDPFNNEKRLNDLCNYISNQQKENFSIPIDTHKLTLETKINRIYFFQNDKEDFNKKYYIYITDKNKIVIKGIKVKRGNCSKIAKGFFETVIQNKILNNTYQPYHPEELLKELKEFSIGKEHLLLKRYRVNLPESYKILEGKEEATGIQYQIAKKYGGGEHWLVINKRIGVGKGNKYCKLEELKEKYKEHYIDQISFEEYMKDLSEFIIPRERNKITKTDRKRIV
jgi:hypothetical protein